MKPLHGWLGAALILAVAGCGGEPARPAPVPPATPLTVAEWQNLDVEKKYEPETFERLKKGDPKLNTDRAWEQFFATVIVPNRKRDIPMDLKPRR
jgi:hypothetical protein